MNDDSFDPMSQVTPLPSARKRDRTTPLIPPLMPREQKDMAETDVNGILMPLAPPPPEDETSGNKSR